MKLYTNGCSFTHGHLPYDILDHCHTYNDYTYTADVRNIAWPWLLSNDFEHTFNHAKAGTGLDRTLRSTLDFVEHLDPCEYNEWIFIIQASQAHRVEYLFPDFDNEVYGQFHHTDTVNMVVDDPNITSNISCNLQVPKDFHYEWQTDMSFEINQIKNILVLQSIFKNMGLTYLFTGMMNRDIRPSNFTKTQTKLLNNLEAQIDTDYTILAMNEILQQYDAADVMLKEDCGHPNLRGNTIIADYIKTELEKRNWLT
jgi:hypothetical protein